MGEERLRDEPVRTSAWEATVKVSAKEISGVVTAHLHRMTDCMVAYGGL